MFKNITALALGVILFSIIIGVGIVVITEFGYSLAECNTGFAFNESLNVCQNASNYTHQANPANAGWTNMNAMVTELGTSGLAGWTASIVAISIGLLFIVALSGKRDY